MIYIYGRNGTAHSNSIRKPDNAQKGSEQTKFKFKFKSKRNGAEGNAPRAVSFAESGAFISAPALLSAWMISTAGTDEGETAIIYIGEVVALF